MDQYAKIEWKIKERGCHLQGVRIALISLSIVLVVACVAAFLQRWGILPIHPLPFLIITGFVFLASGTIAYFFGRSKRIDLARLLFRVDLALKTDEQLIALYEVRRFGKRGFYDALARELSTTVSHVGKALRLSTIDRGAIVVLILLITVLPLALFAGIRLPEEIPAPLLTTEERYHDEVLRELPPPEYSPPDERLELMPAITPHDEPIREQAEMIPHHPLEDILAELWGIDRLSIARAEEGGGDLRTLLDRQRAINEALQDLLTQIEARLRDETEEELTAEEREGLMNLQRKVAHPALQEAIEQILTAGDPETLQEMIAKALQQAVTQEREDREITAPAEAVAPPKLDDEIADHHNDDEITAQVPAETTPREDVAQREGERAAREGDDAEQPLDGELAIDEDIRAGTEGLPAGEEALRDILSEFIHFQLSGQFGPTGEVKEFLTKGVPLETLPQIGPAGEFRYVLNYDLARAILTGRLIPEHLQRLVKEYFRVITEGERR
jgi:DNA-binding protein YbaB